MYSPALIQFRFQGSSVEDICQRQRVGSFFFQSTIFSPTAMSQPYGLEWRTPFLAPVPRWSVLPDVTVILALARSHLYLSDQSLCKVVFAAEGSLNKVYRVETENATFIFRVALPVDPRKVAGEVATMRWVRQHVSTASRDCKLSRRQIFPCPISSLSTARPTTTSASHGS